MTILPTHIVKIMLKLIICSFLAISLLQCNKPIEEIYNVSHVDFTLAYNLEIPNSKNFLKHSLEEISALSISMNEKNLFAVNDEEGKIYILDKEGSGIADVVPFGKRGDYEGIENVNGDLYVLKNSGTLFLIDLDKKEVEKKYKTILSSKNDVEGLGFDFVDSTLLLACKAKAGIEKKIENARAVYKFDLLKKELNEEPYLVISDEKIKSFLNKNRPDREDSPLENAYFNNLKKRASYFSPSGIAVHPKSQNYYIISAVAKLLLVLDREGEILNISFLDTGTFTQPEGICFSQDGTLYIANEAAKAKASVLGFRKIH